MSTLSTPSCRTAAAKRSEGAAPAVPNRDSCRTYQAPSARTPLVGRAETAARFFGTPKYIAGQTIAVIVWIAVNALAVSFRWDPYPFILLNLAFSTQAAYAAPLILLAQTRQADRDKDALDHLEAHREEVMRHMEEREAAIKKETGALKMLIEAACRVGVCEGTQ
ncbi:MAG TPA: DUF1003 domain-containing protein [Gaiellaceae bacterium]|nr:DUF1003 domain-containing protein [Gaiellaceae bacterium]